MSTVSVRRLNIARASILDHLRTARAIRDEAASIAASKRRNPHLFPDGAVARDLAEAERTASAHERRADEIEAEHFSGLLSRPADAARR